MPKLTEGFASRLRVPDGKRDVQVFDDALPGFGIRKFDSGRASYFVKYNVGLQQRRLTLGAVVPGNLAEMRKKASRVLAKARLGEDAVAEKRAAVGKGVTLGHLVPAYLECRASELRSRSYAEIQRHLDRNWRPLHQMAIDAIGRRDVVRIIDDIAAENGKVTADRARTALSTLFAWAIDRNYLEINPTINIQSRGANGGRSRVLSEAELVEVWKSCRDDDHGRIVRLLILTGQRRQEIGDLSEREINSIDRQIELPEERTKNGRPHIVPLSLKAWAILEEVERRDGRQFLFGRGDSGYSGWSKSKLELDARIAAARAKAGINKPMPHWTLHDLRRSVVTHLHERGFAQPHIVEAIVNHVSGHRAGVAGVYNKALYLPDRRSALDLWDTHITALQACG